MPGIFRVVAKSIPIQKKLTKMVGSPCCCHITRDDFLMSEVISLTNASHDVKALFYHTEKLFVEPLTSQSEFDVHIPSNVSRRDRLPWRAVRQPSRPALIPAS
jgi:hypothetical protein